MTDIPTDEDPGVASVTKIYNYYKKFGYKTQVMGASFRKVEQIMRLAGCDLLTISPEILADLGQREGELPRRLSIESAKASDATAAAPRREDLPLHAQRGRRWRSRSCREGIRKFYADACKLEKWASEPGRQGGLSRCCRCAAGLHRSRSRSALR